MRAEPVDDRGAECPPEPVAVAEAGHHDRDQGRARVGSLEPGLDHLRERRAVGRAVADRMLDELELVCGRAPSASPAPLGVPSTCTARAASVRLVHPGRDATVHEHLGVRGDHVLLLRGPRLGRHERHPEHRLDQVGDQLGRRCPQVSRSPARAARDPRRPPRRSIAERNASPSGVASARVVVAQALQQRRQLQESVVAEPRDGCVPGGASRVDPEPEDALLAYAECVEATAAELERDASALVEDVVGPHLLRVLPAQPLGALPRPHLLVSGRRRRGARPAAAASPRGRGPRRLRPRRRPGPSCPARRGREPRPSTTSPAQGSKLHSEGSAGTVSAWPSRHSVGPGSDPRSRATRFGRPDSAASSSHSNPASVSVSARSSWAGSSFPGGFVVSMRISRRRSSTPSVPSSSSAATAASSSTRGRLLAARPRPDPGHTGSEDPHGAPVRHR